MNIVAHNLQAMNSQRMLGLTTKASNKSTEKLSSGYKINRAADDAAGLAISEKMRKQIRGLSQAVQNSQDGISMVQIADGALTEVHEMLQRGNELSVKAANGTLSESDRDYINQELQQLKQAIDQVATNTKFNETYLFPPTGVAPGDAYVTSSNSYSLEFSQSGNIQIIHTASEGDPGINGTGSVNTGNALADKIAGEYVPNAVNQILNKFGSLATKVNGYTGTDADKLKMELKVTYIDGPSNTLAQVEGSFYVGSQALAGMNLVVDVSDFSESDIKNNNTEKLGKLESTIAHEMMHAVMDAALPAGMYPNGGGEDFPKWFKEGTAQLAGGGYTTGWNDSIKNIIRSGTDVNNKISEYLKGYTVQERVYGHGYLAAAYMGYMASGGTGEVTADKIVVGMNRIFSQIISNPNQSLESAVNTAFNAAGSTKTYQDIINDINNGTTDGVAFVRELTTKSLNGAGSVIASGGLNAIATDVLGTSTASAPIYIDRFDLPQKSGYSKNAPSWSQIGMMSIQAGAESSSDNRIEIKLFRMSSEDLGLGSIGFNNERAGNEQASYELGKLTKEGALNAIDAFASAITAVSTVRSYLGAIQNRMEHTIKNLDNVVENTTSAESLLRDTDMAKEMVRFSNNNILQQAGQAMLAQANQSNQGVLSLLS